MSIRPRRTYPGPITGSVRTTAGVIGELAVCGLIGSVIGLVILVVFFLAGGLHLLEAVTA